MCYRQDFKEIVDNVHNLKCAIVRSLKKISHAGLILFYKCQWNLLYSRTNEGIILEYALDK